MKIISHNIALLLTIIVTMTALSSCGSKRRAVQYESLPPISEITLDEYVGSGSFVMTPESPSSEQANAVIKAAKEWIGTPYQYGGESRSGVDCSALVMSAYKTALGIKIPRTTTEQHAFARPVSREHMAVGDLVFFSSRKNTAGISHVGLYIGKDQFIHASTSRGVVIDRLSDEYFKRHYVSTGRILEDSKAIVAPAERITSLDDKKIAPDDKPSGTTNTIKKDDSPLPPDLLEEVLQSTLKQ